MFSADTRKLIFDKSNLDVNGPFLYVFLLALRRNGVCYEEDTGVHGAPMAAHGASNGDFTGNLDRKDALRKCPPSGRA